MEKYFDIHNHLFNKNFLAKELLYRLVKEMKKLIIHDREGQSDRGVKDKVKKLKETIKTLQRIRYTIKVFTQKNSKAIFDEMNKTYKDEFILTPLTFDLTYCFAESADRDGEANGSQVKKVFDSEMENLFGEIEKSARSLSRDFNHESSAEEDQLWKEYQNEKEQFLLSAAKLQQQYDEDVRKRSGTRGISIFPNQYDGFEEQIRQLKEMKEDPKYKDKVFPFLAVDPRREGIAEYAMENVGKGNLFIGVKLYCPNGYSPTDPLLFGPEGERGGIYAFCEDNGIPVTAHNSDGGFATLAKSVLIDGLIYFNGELKQMNKERVTFKTSILGKDAVYERAVTLNHPLIWRKVVEKYPNLILNLAHFGGGQQLEGAIDHPDIPELWSNRIIELLTDPRYKVYTDVSCFSEFNILKKFVASPVFQQIKSRVLYGSDFILLLIFENDFNENVRQFMEIFADDFDVIAGTNPREFLKHVY